MRKLFRKIAAYLVMFEGLEHFVVSTVAVVGLVHAHNHQWFAWSTPLWDYLMGSISLVGGWFLKGGHSHGKRNRHK